MIKKALPAERKIENDKLKAIYEAKKKELGLSQLSLADALDISQSGVSHYLNGINPLNAQVAAAFSKLLQVPVDSFSPRLAAEMSTLAQAIRIPAAVKTEPNEQSGTTLAALLRLKGKATPRSLEVLKRIEKAALEGRLQEADLIALEGIAARFEALNKQS